MPGRGEMSEEEGLIPPSGRGRRSQAHDRTDGSSPPAPMPGVLSYGPTPLDSVGTTNNAYRYGLVAGRVSATRPGGRSRQPEHCAYAGFSPAACGRPRPGLPDGDLDASLG